MEVVEQGLKVLGTLGKRFHITWYAPYHRLAQITPVAIPEGVDDGKVRTRLANDFKIEVSRGLGQFAGKIWRIGLMGEASTAGNLLQLLSALEEILPQEGYEVPVGAGVAAASKALASS